MPGTKWCITGTSSSPIADLCDEVIVVTPEIEQSYCHTASYTCAVAALAALRGEDISELPAAVAAAIEDPFPVSAHERWLVAGAGRDWPTAQEAVLKLREGAFVAAEAYETEQLLHGYLAAVDESVRCFVLEGEGRAAERAQGAVAALEELGCDVTLVADHESGRGHRPLPGADRRARRAARSRSRPDPPRRRALGPCPRRLRLKLREQLGFAVGAHPGRELRVLAAPLERVARGLLMRRGS